MNGYELSRKWFDYCFENQGKIQPIHTALYFWIIEKFNRFGWVEKMSFPASEAMAATGVSHNTYRKAFEKLVEIGAIVEVKKSQNQFIACIIALPKNGKPNGEAIGKALGKATGEPLAMLLVDQLRYNKTINQEPITINQEQKDADKNPLSIESQNSQPKQEEKKEPKEKNSAKKEKVDWNTISMDEAWLVWVEYRKKKRKPISEGAEQDAAMDKLREMSGHQTQTAILIIKESISNGWQGLFPLKNESNGQQQGIKQLRNGVMSDAGAAAIREGLNRIIEEQRNK